MSTFSIPSSPVSVRPPVSQVSQVALLFASFLCTLVALVFVDLWSALAFGAFSYSVLWYIESLGKEVCLRQIVALIASMQWLLGPMIAYQASDSHYKYRMYVDEASYMSFAVPAVIALIVGLNLLSRERRFLDSISALKAAVRMKATYAFLLVTLGLVADGIDGFLPGPLLFVAFLVSQFKFVGVFYLLLAKHPLRWVVGTIIGVLAIWDSTQNAMFHNTILWAAFFVSFFCLEYKISRGTKWVVLLSGLLLLAMLQTVKGEFREQLIQGYQGSRVILLIDLMMSPGDARSFTGVRFTDLSFEDYIQNINVRINQGWIISAVLAHTPSREPYAGGETIQDAVVSAMVPRFLVDKESVWAGEKFIRFTGLMLRRDTTMGISVLGEGYVNFGRVGGVLFMFVWGALIGGLLMMMTVAAKRYPTAILWIPFVFLQVIKAETEFVVVLNHLVKALIVLVLFYWGAHRIMGWKV